MDTQQSITTIDLEVCANSVQSAIAAQEGGAVRVEFCDNLAEGGTTPSYGQLAVARKYLHIKLYPIIRPRGGDFLYSDIEFEIMKEDVKTCKALGCDGIVIGILKADGSIDKKRCAELIALAQPMPVAFHRAFDMTADPLLALEDIIELGCERILTSGCASSAIQGVAKIAEFVERAQGRISIMPGAGVTEDNIGELVRLSGANEFHSTAKVRVQSKMEFRNAGSTMGASADEFSIEQSDATRVRTIIENGNKAL